jgi:Acyl-coenzyme A:6-aminopenicillanic acid acyl-transferase
MKKLLLIFTIHLLWLYAAAQDALNKEQRIPSGCTVITISKGDTVFFAGNDDFINPDSWYWVEPGDSSNYGVIWIGTPDNPQQGINEKGLAYDANGLPRFEVNPHTERIPVQGGYYHNYIMQIMHECSTVDEVINWINTHQRFPYMHDQLHIADKKGDAVIISAGKDGEMVFTRKEPGDAFLVSSNFNVANPSNGYSYPCWRYDKANELLGQLINKEEPLSFNDVTKVMDAVHQESSSWTIETLVADLVNGVMYLYYFYQYENPVIINVKDELANPREAGPLSKLFPREVQQEATKRYRQVTKNIRINNVIGRSWAALIIISMALLFILPARSKGLRFWIPAVIALGPVAILAKLMTLNSGKISVWRSTVIEVVGNLIPVIIAYLFAIVVMVLKMISGGINEQQQALLILGLPLLTSWIIFHSPLLSLAGKKNFGRFMFQRLPQVLAATLLGLAGIFPVTMVLVNKSLAMSQIIPLSPWIVMTWFAIIVAGSLVGGLLIFLYELWAVKRGYQAWNVFAGNEGGVITPKWGKIWWWLIISVLILFAGFIIGVMLLKIMAA